MITNQPIFSTLHSDSHAKDHYNKASEALYMVRGILGVLRGAADSDYNSLEVYAGDVARSVEAALFLADIAQEHVDLLHAQLVAPTDEVEP
nr:hypothetical protein [uncultured Desulfobulbus sp.]